MWLIKSLVISLGLTVLLELLFAVLWGLDKNYFRLIAAVNILTNPIVVGCHHLTRIHFPLALAGVTLVLELLAIVTEGMLYKKHSDMKLPLLFSVCANGFSYFTGVLLNRILSHFPITW